MKKKAEKTVTKTYPNIDMVQTGLKLKRLLESAGYTPRMIQEYLHLSCVQPVYRWYKGLILPSVDHLFMLSELLHIHMEELLVKKNKESFTFDFENYDYQGERQRMICYCSQLIRLVA